MVQHKHDLYRDGAVRGSVGWLLRSELLCLLMNLLYYAFKDEFFNTFDLKVVTKCGGVLYHFISWRSYRCGFKANSVVLEKVCTSSYLQEDYFKFYHLFMRLHVG